MPDSHVMTLADDRDLGCSSSASRRGGPSFGFHGTPGSRLQLALASAPSSGAGVRLILVDRPGYGLSSFQPGRRLVDWPADVAQLADHLGLKRFSVFGVSGGGPHSAVCAARLGDRVALAAIVSGVGPLSEPGAAEGMMRTNQVIAHLARRRSKLLHVTSAAQTAVVRRWPNRAVDLMASGSRRLTWRSSSAPRCGRCS